MSPEVEALFSAESELRRAASAYANALPSQANRARMELRQAAYGYAALAATLRTHKPRAKRPSERKEQSP